MAGIYITKPEGAELSLGAKSNQSFHHRFATDRTHNEAITIRWFCEQPQEYREWLLEVMAFLSRFYFATKDQILLYMKNRGFDVSHADEYFNVMLSRRFLNSFYLCEVADPEPDEGKSFPDDAFIVYCLDMCAKQVLVPFYRDDLIYWRVTDNYRSSGQIAKYLSTCQFFLELFKVKQDHLLRFDAVYDAAIGRRTARFSAFFVVSDGSEAPREFILESVRKDDVPGYWGRKVTDQVFPYVDRGYYKQSFSGTPFLVLLAENDEVAKEAAEAVYQRLPGLKFCVTTDSDVANGLATATFYRVSPSTSEDGVVSNAYTPVKASIFTKY